jgi:subtilase family serine protease
MGLSVGGSRTRLQRFTMWAAAAASLTGLAAAPAFASAATARTVVGSAVRLPEHTQVLGGLSATRRLALTVSLEPRDPAALARYATAVSTPGHSDYGHFLTVPRFAARFGAPRSHIAAVRRTLRRDGLTIGRLDRNDLTLAVSGSTTEVEHAFRVSEFAVRADGRRAFANSSEATLPASIAAYVQAVNGFDDVTLDNAVQPQLAPRGARRSLARTAHTAPRVATNGGPQPCPAATAEATSSNGGLTADEIATAYGFPALYQSGDLGQGQTIGLFEISQDIPTDPATYFACYGIAPTVTVTNVNGGPAASGDDGEVALDIEIVAGLAPKAAIDVYQGSPALSAAPALYGSAISADQAKILSASLGACEPNDPASIAAAENTLFQEAATQGQTMLASSGDQGSSACDTSSGASTALAVDDPASQPFVTGVGGTSLFSGSGQPMVYTGTQPPVQGVWNDGDNGQVSGTGGGISTRSAMPTYQSTAAGSLAVIGPDSSGAPCGATSGDCREVPDVSADADPDTGYTVYATTGGNPAEWTVIGGTSAASPVWAAFMAETNDLPACRGLTIGFANPLLYAVASAAYNTNFTDITDPSPITGAANNDAAGVNNGLYPVGTGYDMATGLGSMTSTLASSLCAARAPVFTVAVASPGAVTGTVGTAFALAVHGTDSGNAPVTYAASGLPAGLAINPSTGVISGTPTTAQATTVTVSATDAYTNAGSVQFPLTVVNPPVVVTRRPTLAKVGSLKLGGLSKRKPKLAFTLGAGAGAPALKSLSIKLPSGLSFATKAKSLDKGITIKAGRKKAKFKARVKKGVLTITLSKTERSITLTVVRPALAITRAEAQKIKHKKVKKLVLGFRVVNSSKASKTLKVTVRKLA